LGPKERITDYHRILGIGVAYTGTTGGEVGLVFIFRLLLVPLI
jgi:hypothetical protein